MVSNSSTRLDYVKTQEIVEKLHTLETKSRPELHLTDALYCPLKAACRIWGIKPKFTRRTAAIFIRGLMFDELVKRCFETTEVEKKLGISVGHPDVIDGIFPIEIKHTSKHIRSKIDIPKIWLDQLELECVYCNVKKGWLFIGELDTTLVTAWEHKISLDYSTTLEHEHMTHMEVLQTKIENREPAFFEPKRKECADCFFNYKEDSGGCPRRPGMNHEKK